MGLSFLEGNEAIAHGAVAAGCNFFAGYPITPATTVYNTMLSLLPPSGGVCLQGEDEIASMGFCLGASMAGKKVLTATSGPGISLYSEQISFAIGSEIPVVIVDVQRLGPSTGSATRGADGDVQFLQWGSSGGLPVIVLAPADVRDCYLLTVHAFNLAEKFRCPVFLASNKEIAMTKESIDLSAIPLPDIVERQPAGPNQPFRPFASENNHSAPPFLPIGGDTLVRQTSSTHGTDGYITIDPAVIESMQQRLDQKLMAHVDALTFYDTDIQEGADTLVITYGVTSRSAVDAVASLRSEGKAASLLVLKTLWPVPEAVIRQLAAPVSRVVVTEMNMGLYLREIERLLPDKTIGFMGHMSGKLVTPHEIREVVTNG
ncbi:MAG: pyruvate flavodoxin/ferredoxin oxidoreductase [Desulfobacteraceae bacterium]|nr:pyruvate flavodoxin/ferredoxin oxidoreductase [Desulfobacteraceae bacterium]